MKRFRKAPALVLLVSFCAVVCLAWHGPGHHLATRLAVGCLRGQVPDFFVEGAATVAHCSVDPDLARDRSLVELRDEEYSEHFFDQELLKGAPLPPTRYEFIALCYQKGVKPAAVGFLPYTVVERTQRLAVAFAEHRRWPANPHIRTKCLVYAGLLSHYAEDLCQPLHITVHYDGRVGPDGKSPRSGIHNKVDALLQKLAADPDKLAFDPRPVAFEKLMPAVLQEMGRSAALVDRVYELEAQLPAAEEPIKPGSPVESFAHERLRAAVHFTASLYLTAWRLSETIALPEWLTREGE